ncbi:hypothetical protein OZ410_04185 [Robiginitalea sp. M366]|uniref:hypothetical protein n=1 Tax=Robiginitalea aestuariiviva TaxID=3036903 RepID=UPI00240D0BE4|nr:hypothetical protein [Robiginitalea aestuariiviva]MDG1571502.1 hypothetical protein [Robiginitalea aestuariiviva]
MSRYNEILGKLKGFYVRYYQRQLVIGLILTLVVGGLLVILMAGLEYWLWMGQRARLVMFWFLALILLGLVLHYLLRPALYLFRIRKGLSAEEGARIIGRHFPKIGDRLLNLIELGQEQERSELLLASIEQRSEALKGVNFTQALPWRTVWRYARYLAIPAVIVMILAISGKALDWWESYQRIRHYEMAYTPPAPFRFQLVNTKLVVLENETVVLRVRTVGDIRPDNPEVVIGGSPLLMEASQGEFTYTLRPPLQTTEFYFRSGSVQSGGYQLQVLDVPMIERMEMRLEYPTYLNRPAESLRGSGNATVPEGTQVSWQIGAVHTDTVTYKDSGDTLNFKREGQVFTLEKVFRTSENYTLSTSNTGVRDFDKIAYAISVVTDQYPELDVRMHMDSLQPGLLYFEGEAADDYGLDGIRLEVWPTEMPDSVIRLNIPGGKSRRERFYYTYPSGLNVLPDRSYALEFVVSDNDGLRGGKETRSQTFVLENKGELILRQERIEAQQGLFRKMENQIETGQELREAMEQMQEDNLEQKTLSYNEQRELRDIMERQFQQEELMQKYNRELSKSLSETEEKTPFKELLQERLERQELEAQKNARLMEELQEVLDQLEKEELQERLEEISRQQNNNQRSLEQILELTKRYFVEQRSRVLAQKLGQLAREQDTLGQINYANPEREADVQEDLIEDFQNIGKELGELERDNQQLQKPLDWKRDKGKEKSVSDNQEQALDAIKQQMPEEANDASGNNAPSDAKRAQKNAARMMQELSDALSGMSMSGSSSDSAEDAEVLRQILDNLLVFSFKEELLFDQVRDKENATMSISGDIRAQQELKELFEHVDDSLFTLSLRRPELGEEVNQKVTDVYYNLDKGIESLAENQWYRATSYSQYVITASNDLAALLAEILENMQQSLQMGAGQGQGEGMQLPDIIKSQQELQEGLGGTPKGSPSGSAQGDGAQGSQGEGQNRGEQRDKQSDNQGQGDQGNGNPQEGERGQGLNETQLAEVFEIYKEQQRIRAALERQLEDMIRKSDQDLAKGILQEMERFESDLLRNGITQRTGERLNRIQQQLLRLEDAELSQGEREERESQTNIRSFTNPVFSRPILLQEKEIEVEILNKQVLPLRGRYKDKVRQYFKGND